MKAMRKKLSEMTPMERVDRSMKGMTWDEAEEVGIYILAKCFAYHVHVKDDKEAFIQHIGESIINRGVEWARENAFVLAMARSGERLKNEEQKEQIV